MVTEVTFHGLQAGDVLRRIRWPQGFVQELSDHRPAGPWIITQVSGGCVFLDGRHYSSEDHDLIYIVEREDVPLVRVPCKDCGVKLHPALAKFTHLCRL